MNKLVNTGIKRGDRFAVTGLTDGMQRTYKVDAVTGSKCHENDMPKTITNVVAVNQNGDKVVFALTALMQKEAVYI